MGIRILLLEDNNDDAELLRRRLDRSDLKFEIKLVSDGPGFIDALNAFAPDLVLSDHQLHDFSSTAALKVSREKYPYLPFILVTGAVSEEFAAGIVRAGADDYILKHNLERLPTAIKQAIEKQRAAEDLKRSNERLLFLIGNSPLGFVESDREFRIKAWSKRAEEIFGWTEKELIELKHTGQILIHPDDRGQLDGLGEKMLSGEIQSHTIRHRNVTKDGRVIWCEWHNAVQRDRDGKFLSLLSLVQDITEQKEAEIQKEFHQNNTEALINNTHDLMWSVDKDLRLITSNQSFDELTRMMSGGIIAKGDDVLAIGFGEAALKKYRGLYKRALAGDTFKEIEHTTVPVENWSEISFYPIMRSGEVVGTACFARDITAKVRAEKELFDREQRFRALIENSSDAIVLNDSSLNITYQSPSVKRIFGHEIEERRGRKVVDYIHPGDKEDFLKYYKSVMESPGQPIPFQYRFRHTAGHYMWLEGVLTNLIHDPTVKAIITNYRDVTVRKVAQENLELTLKRFRQAQEIAHVGHWQVDFATQTSTWSEEAFRIYGIAPGTAAPSEELFLKYVHPEDLERVKGITQEASRTLKSCSFIHRIVQDSGAVRSLLSTSLFEFDKDNRPTGLYGISLDITELTEKERDLELANKELETFIYRTYHDLRAPIASVLGLVNVANKETTPDKAMMYLNMIGQIAVKQNIMLTNLSAVMTIRNRKLAIESFNLTELLNEVTRELKAASPLKEVALTINNSLGETVLSDRDLLNSILYQLLDNSIMYRDTAKPTPSIWLEFKVQDPEFVLLIVKDNGQGLSPSVKDRVFDMFFRGNVNSAGWGLGLYLVKNAVDKLGGTIAVEAQENVGTEIRISLPVTSLRLPSN